MQIASTKLHNIKLGFKRVFNTLNLLLLLVIYSGGNSIESYYILFM